MILTGKCKEDFLVWYFNSYLKEDKYCLIKDVERFFETINKLFQNALIIEFFDSVGIYASAYICHDNTFDFSINNITYNSFTKTRQEATTEAIKKANEIYNEAISS